MASTLTPGPNNMAIPTPPWHEWEVRLTQQLTVELKPLAGDIIKVSVRPPLLNGVAITDDRGGTYVWQPKLQQWWAYDVPAGRTFITASYTGDGNLQYLQAWIDEPTSSTLKYAQFTTTDAVPTGAPISDADAPGRKPYIRLHYRAQPFSGSWWATLAGDGMLYVTNEHCTARDTLAVLWDLYSALPKHK